MNISEIGALLTIVIISCSMRYPKVRSWNVAIRTVEFCWVGGGDVQHLQRVHLDIFDVLASSSLQLNLDLMEVTWVMLFLAAAQTERRMHNCDAEASHVYATFSNASASRPSPNALRSLS